MSKIAVVYWSGTGNTAAMAVAVADGAKEKGAEAVILPSSDFDISMVDQYDAIAFGCPAMGAEVLEEGEFDPMFESCKPALNGKKIALFGSYGWGDGEWMRLWEDAVSYTHLDVYKRQKTPCAVKGDKCYRCESPDNICHATVSLELPGNGMKAEVVLIDEELGY